jgi:hypothetical protein
MDELTAVNAQIAKGPQRVDIETFLEPHTYKAQRADPNNPFPPEHEDLWKALDAAADEVLANQAKAGDQALRSMRRAADIAQVDELRQATPHLDDFVEMFRGGVFLNEMTRINGMPSTPLYGFTSRADINALAEQVVAMDPRWGARTNGIRMLGLPGNRYIAWQGHLDFHDNVYMQLNDMLAERGLPPIPIEDVASIHIPVDPSKTGAKRFGKVDIQTFAGEGNPSNKALMNYGDFALQLDTYTASGAAFTRR